MNQSKGKRLKTFLFAIVYGWRSARLAARTIRKHDQNLSTTLRTDDMTVEEVMICEFYCAWIGCDHQ